MLCSREWVKFLINSWHFVLKQFEIILLVKVFLTYNIVQVINEDYNTKLRVVDAKRSDAGTYTLVAKNINGRDTATVNVAVLG